MKVEIQKASDYCAPPEILEVKSFDEALNILHNRKYKEVVHSEFCSEEGPQVHHYVIYFDPDNPEELPSITVYDDYME